MQCLLYLATVIRDDFFCRKNNLQFSLYPVRYRTKFLLETSYVNHTATVSLSTLKPLDHEVDRRVTLRLTATNPETQEQAFAIIDVFVKNENDNAPIFTNKIYSLKAPIKSHRFSVVGLVSAKDADGDQIVYSLAKRNGPFIIIPQTGEILLTEDPQLKMYLRGFEVILFYEKMR